MLPSSLIQIPVKLFLICAKNNKYLWIYDCLIRPNKMAASLSACPMHL